MSDVQRRCDVQESSGIMLYGVRKGSQGWGRHPCHSLLALFLACCRLQNLMLAAKAASISNMLVLQIMLGLGDGLHNSEIPRKVAGIC